MCKGVCPGGGECARGVPRGVSVQGECTGVFAHMGVCTGVGAHVGGCEQVCRRARVGVCTREGVCTWVCTAGL